VRRPDSSAQADIIASTQFMEVQKNPSSVVSPTFVVSEQRNAATLLSLREDQGLAREFARLALRAGIERDGPSRWENPGVVASRRVRSPSDVLLGSRRWHFARR